MHGNCKLDSQQLLKQTYSTAKMFGMMTVVAVMMMMMKTMVMMTIMMIMTMMTCCPQVNFVLFLNIIRVLFTKLNAVNSPEAKKFRYR